MPTQPELWWLVKGRGIFVDVFGATLWLAWSPVVMDVRLTFLLMLRGSVLDGEDW